MKIERLNQILDQFPQLHILVIGDFFLDQYLMLDRGLSERSVETDLECYQVTEIRNSPGSAGTVVNNLRSVDIPTSIVGVIGNDGRGFDLKKEFGKRNVCMDDLIETDEIMTQTYTKPMMQGVNEPLHELERIDIKCRKPLSDNLQRQLCNRLGKVFPKMDGVIVLDQLADQEAGVFPSLVREKLDQLGASYPQIPYLVDSRFRNPLFHHAILKCNDNEAMRTTNTQTLDAAVSKLFVDNPRGAFVSLGAEGMLVCKAGQSVRVPGVKVEGPIDIVGAGDSAAAGIMGALCAGATYQEAAEIGNIIASITIQQIGTTGTATRESIRAVAANLTQ